MPVQIPGPPPMPPRRGESVSRQDLENRVNDLEEYVRSLARYLEGLRQFIGPKL